MIIFTQSVVEEVNRLHALEGNRTTHDIESVVTLAGLFDTTSYGEGGVTKSHMYWEFLHAVLNNIKTGTWTSYPNMWTETYRISDTDDLTILQVESENVKYLQHRTDLLKDLNIGPGMLQDRKLLLKWLRNPNGFFDMLKTAYALSNMHIITTSVPLVVDYPV